MLEDRTFIASEDIPEAGIVAGDCVTVRLVDGAPIITRHTRLSTPPSVMVTALERGALRPADLAPSVPHRPRPARVVGLQPPTLRDRRRSPQP